PDLVPSDIRITGNLISKPLSWRSEKWQVKNLLELKNARRVTIDGNILQNNWQAAQVGFAALFTVRNQDGGCLWCQVDHVVFERNLVQHSASCVSILGFADGDGSRYPRGNRCPSLTEFRAQFVSYASGDYQLNPDSSWRLAGNDGRDLGADIVAVRAATSHSRITDRKPPDHNAASW